MGSERYRVLTCNSHEAYVWALSKVGIDLDIIDQLPGRYTRSWDTNVRPIPENARLLTTEEALTQGHVYDCFIGHSIDDLLLVKSLDLPKILLLHVSLYGYMAQEQSDLSPKRVQEVLSIYLKKIRASVVAISRMKMQSWGVQGKIIPHYVDTEFFKGYRGDLPQGLRVVNQLTAKNVIVDAAFHLKLERINPIRIIGFNPDLEDVQPSKDLEDLLARYQEYRYYVHTATPQYEDGYNLASLEAMAVGMPVVTNAHPSSPVENGVHGFKSDSVDELSRGIALLKQDIDLARSMGAACRKLILEQHSFHKFNAHWLNAIADAIQSY